jgi:signal transduction histidine kinase
MLWGTLTFAATAGPVNTDSLERVLPRLQGRARVDALNVLTYEFITRDNEKVQAYNEEAVRVSKETGYVLGEAWATTYKGVQEYLSGHLPEARHDLKEGLELFRASRNRSGEGYALLQLGICNLENVQSDSALHYFRQSYDILKDSSDASTLSKLYRNISALYGQRSQADSQRIYLEKAIRIRRLLPDKTLLADALVMQANVNLRSGNFPDADSLLSEAQALLRNQPENEESINDVRHLKALILFHQGRFDEATALFDSARNYYFRLSLIRKYVTLLSDMGRVFTDRGEYELALNNLYDALSLARLRGFEVETSIVRNQIGWVVFHLGDMKQALSLANEVLKPGQRLLEADRANAMTLRGVVLTNLRDFGPARSCLDSVLRMYERLGDRRGRSETLMNLGYLEGIRENYDLALRFHDESVWLAKEAGYNYGLSWSYWGIGDIYFKRGQLEEAIRYLDLSEQVAHTIGSNEVLILAYNTRRDLLASQNRYKESLSYSIRATQLKDSIHRADLARRFVNLEKIHEIEERDRDIQSLQKDKQLAQDKIELQESKLRQQSLLLFLGLLGLGLLGALAFAYYRFYARIRALNVSVVEKNHRIQAQADKLQEVNLELQRLYQEVSEQKEMIQAQADELGEANRSMNEINQSLERMVAEKTAELRSTNEELAKHNNELLQFSYTVSHNLRGPVARLLGLSDLAQTEQNHEQIRQWTQLIHKTSSDLDLVIKDLSKILDLQNVPRKYREVVDLQAEWNQSRGLLQDSLSGHEEIIANFQALPKIVSVRAMVQSIFYNLLSNAIKYHSPERKLRIVASSRQLNGQAIVEVADNGLGFNKQLHGEKLFKLYRRFHTHVEGRGLGLYLVKTQTDLLHGSVEVDSEPDKGTVFRVILPLESE